MFVFILQRNAKVQIHMYVKVWNFTAAMLLEKLIVFLSLIYHCIPVSATSSYNLYENAACPGMEAAGF